MTQGLHNLVAPAGARQAKKRLGRGRGSGLGKTSGRGHKGQKKTKSGNVRVGFEGGQLPLARRLPKVGFKNFDFKVSYAAVNLGRLGERFPAGAVVDPAALVAAGLVNPKDKVKVLAAGELKHKLSLKVHAISAAARQKLEALGGSVELLVKAATGPAADAPTGKAG
ncbi:MAG: 50S ribosomal protein L15 [Deltaproteobacteria bacterium]|nr:50S ribosomal protein L15 [Deltaproteobacteria bacterium]